MDKAMQYYVRNAANDPPRQLEVRAEFQKEPFGPVFHDYVSYTCPVRNCLSIALLDSDGRWWTALEWHEEGSFFYGDPERDTELPYPYVQSPREFRHIALTLLRAANTYFWALQFGPPEDRYAMFSLTEDAWVLDPQRHLAQRAKVCYYFDREWGQDSFFLSLDAAKQAHRKRIRRDAAKANKRRVKLP